MVEVDPAAFGNRVAARREKLGISQTALAKAVGMRQQGIDAIEQGRVKRPRLLRELVSALKTTEDWLLWRKGPEEPPAPQAATEADLRRIPLLDKVTAGKLRASSSQIPVEDVPLLAFADLGRGDFFALTVDGDSMDRWSPDGSIIVVNQADRTLVSGKAYVISQRGEATFKMWRPDPPRFAPYSTNPSHEPIFVRSKADAEKLVVGRVKRTVLDL